MNNQQAQTSPPIARELSEDDKRLVTLFADMRGKQLDFLDEAGKSVIKRIATFLAVLFAVTAFSNNFPPPYLKGNIPAKVAVICTLIFFLASLYSAILVIRPFPYTHMRNDLDEMRKALREMTAHKSRWLKWANILFTLGSIMLGALIVTIIWNV